MLGLLLFVLIILGFIPLGMNLVRLAKDEKVPGRKWKNSIVIAVVNMGFWLILFCWFFPFYTEYLWFKNLGFSARFWRVFFAKWKMFLGFGFLSFLFLFANLRAGLNKLCRIQEELKEKESSRKICGYISFWASLIFALILGGIATGFWEKTLLYFNQVQSGTIDPIFGRDISFYLFSLPFYGFFKGWLYGLFFMTLACWGIIALLSTRDDYGDLRDDWKMVLNGFLPQMFFLLSLVFFLNVWGNYLARYRLMYSGWGVVAGAGYTDIHARLPGYSVFLFVQVIVGLILLLSMSEKVRSVFFNNWKRITTVSVLWFFILAGCLWIIPGLNWALFVRPNENKAEEPYIKHNIQYTRQAFALSPDRMEEKEFPFSDDLTQQMLSENSMTIRNIRLWDWRPLKLRLKQTQEIRLYYEFEDVDIDRYILDGKYTQVMLAPRELEKGELQQEAQTWINKQLRYTHGYGVTLNPVNSFIQDGQPDLLVKDIPPVVLTDGITIKRPEIYYGQRTNDHIYVQTGQKEFDYPKGDTNVECLYQGNGGVSIGSGFFSRKFAFAWRFDGIKLFLSGYITPETRVMFHRNINDRVRTLLPFLSFDEDSYIVVSDEGRLKWIWDSYTTSKSYPYSESYQEPPYREEGKKPHLDDVNYIRNSVKAVVDAYDGDISFYVFEEKDPVIQTYMKIFPGLFKKAEEMPDDLKKHIRYPEDLMYVQAKMYAIYHMSDIQVFYNKEDVWEIAKEKYRTEIQEVTPYYVIIKLPEEIREEYLQMLPFTPKNKNVIISWMAGRCDMPNYGKLIVFKFPKGRLITGPLQVEARIDQDSEMSATLTLWDQRGSQVIRGNTLAIPISNTILYVEPIYLQAENIEIPEIKKVVLFQEGKGLVWADTFDEALNALMEGRVIVERPSEVTIPTEAEVTEVSAMSLQNLVKQANEHFLRWQELTGQGKYEEAAKELRTLRETLNALQEKK